LKEYELLYIVSPRVAVDDVPNTIERVSALVTDSGGEVLSVDNWGRRRMAYPIRHYFEGTYVVMTLRMEPSAAAPLEASLIISEDVLRHLLTEGIIPPVNRDRDRDRRPMGDDRERERGPEDRPTLAEAPRAEAPESDQQPAAPAETPEPAPAVAE
jgi:small subunit ribosomal protein S6